MTVAALGLAVDSSQVSRATPELQKMAAAAGQAEGAAVKLSRAGTGTAGAMQRVSTATAAAEREMAALTTRVTGAGVAFERAGNTVAANANRINASVTGMRFQTAGLAAQFQDIGVTAAMGMSPLIIGLQQGTQLAGQLATMTNPIKGLGLALVSLVSPVSLLTIGFTTLLAVGLQWGASLLTGANDAKRALADEAMSLDQVRGAITSLSNVTDTYAESILDTGRNQSAATASILANTEKEFNAKRSLLELELKRQRAAIDMQKAEVAAKQSEAARIAASMSGPNIASNSVARGNDPRGGDWLDVERWRAFNEVAGPVNDKIKELRANIDLAEIGASGLEDAIGTTFSESVATSMEEVSERTSKTAAKLADQAAEKMAEMRSRMEAELQPLIGAMNDPFVTLQSNLDKLGAWLQNEGPAAWDLYAEGVRRANLSAASGVLGAVGQITGALAGAFEDNKALAVANAVINTAEGVTKALAQGGIFGFASAAAIGISGAAQIASILNAKPGSASTAPVTSAAPATGGEAAAAQGQSIYFNIRGSGSVNVEDIVEQMTKQIADGGHSGFVKVVRSV